MSFSEYTNKNTEEVLSMFKTSPSGLSKKEAMLYQQKYGLNEIKVKNTQRLNTFLFIKRHGITLQY